MNLIFSVFVSHPPPTPTLFPPVAPPSPPGTPISILPSLLLLLLSFLDTRVSSPPPPPPLPPPPPPSVVRFRVIKRAAASLGFYLGQQKKINFERRHGFPSPRVEGEITHRPLVTRPSSIHRGRTTMEGRIRRMEA